jgi:hypothetical protein
MELKCVIADQRTRRLVEKYDLRNGDLLEDWIGKYLNIHDLISSSSSAPLPPSNTGPVECEENGNYVKHLDERMKSVKEIPTRVQELLNSQKACLINEIHNLAANQKVSAPQPAPAKPKGHGGQLHILAELFPDTPIGEHIVENRQYFILSRAAPAPNSILIRFVHSATSVNSTTVKQFNADLMNHSSNCGGILICTGGFITDKMPFHMDRSDSKSFMYLSMADNIDYTAIRHAVKAIDFINETVNLEPKHEGALFTLSDERYKRLCDDLASFDGTHRSALNQMQEAIDTMKKLDLAIFKEYLSIRDSASETDTVETTRAHQMGNLGVLIEEFVNDEVEESLSFGCVNFSFLYEAWKQWVQPIQDWSMISKDDLHDAFMEKFGCSAYCKDGTCGRIYNSEQALEWCAREINFEDGVIWNLRVHDGWKGYKLKNAPSCELKKRSTKKVY